MQHTGYEKFEQWADAALAVPIPESVVAYNFNIAETSESFVVEIIGSPVFDAEDSDWACEEEFVARDPMFELPCAEVGEDWEPVLEQVRTFVVQYVAESPNGGQRLRNSKGVGVGFVDGDVILVGGQAIS